MLFIFAGSGCLLVSFCLVRWGHNGVGVMFVVTIGDVTCCNNDWGFIG